MKSSNFELLETSDAMTSRLLRSFVAAVSLVTLSTPLLATRAIRTTGPVSAISQLPDGLQFRSGDVLARITLIRPGIFLVRYTTHPDYPADHSAAVVPQPRSREASSEASQAATTLKLTDGSIVMTVNRANGFIT